MDTSTDRTGTEHRGEGVTWRRSVVGLERLEGAICLVAEVEISSGDAGDCGGRTGNVEYVAGLRQAPAAYPSSWCQSQLLLSADARSP
jgi:hypothetical protein